MHIFNKATRELGPVGREKAYCLILKTTVEILLANYNSLNIKNFISQVPAAVKQQALRGGMFFMFSPRIRYLSSLKDRNCKY